MSCGKSTNTRVARFASNHYYPIQYTLTDHSKVSQSDNVSYHFSVIVLKLLKMAKGIRALLDTVMQALPQVGNLGLLFFLLFFIFAALGVELFGRLGKQTTFFTN